jgi:hypothetical protein
MRSPCGNHAHGDQNPSLEVQSTRNPRYGRFPMYGYAPGCKLYTEKDKVIDAFGVYCTLEWVLTKGSNQHPVPLQVVF